MPLTPTFQIGIWNAWIFMSVFIIQMFIIMFADKRIQQKSHVPMKAKQNKFEKNIGIIANIIWFAALIYSIFLPFRLCTIWFYAGLFVFLIGFVLLWLGTISFMTTPVDQMITKGVYKISRHPMYLATFFICLGTGIAGASWLFILLTIIMQYCFHHEALVEERYCIKMYGDEYKDYMNTVRRWI